MFDFFASTGWAVIPMLIVMFTYYGIRRLYAEVKYGSEMKRLNKALMSGPSWSEEVRLDNEWSKVSHQYRLCLHRFDFWNY